MIILLENQNVPQQNELIIIAQQLARSIIQELRHSSPGVAGAGISPYLKFPEDLIVITGGYIAESTIRNWKTQGFLKTIKIGTRAFVKPEDWEWFLANHRELMQKSQRNRKNRLGTKNGNRE